jgi:hypothetical protein
MLVRVSHVFASISWQKVCIGEYDRLGRSCTYSEYLIEHHRQGFWCDSDVTGAGKKFKRGPADQGGMSCGNVFSTPSKIFAGARKVWSSKLY